MKHQDNQGYAVGQQVVGKVDKLLPYGVFVCLADGTQAYIRRRELTWAGNVDPRELWQVGDKIEGIIREPAGPGQNMELSHRATLPDPWNEFANRFQPGDVVKGTVKSLMEYGVFVEITPGVDGLIPLQELTMWKVQKPEDVIWIGDTVEAVIVYLDRQTKKLRLSIRARMRQLEAVAGIMEHLSLSPLDLMIGESDEFDLKDGETDGIQEVSFSEPVIDPFMLERIGRILVVDDYDEIRRPLVEWLRHLGCRVDEAKNAEEADEKIQRKSYGLLFADINLPGMDGVAFLQQIRRAGIKCHLAVMSAAEWLAERSREIEEIGVIETFAKPLDLDEIKLLLTRIGQGQALPLRQAEPESARIKAPDSFTQLTTAMRAKTSLTDQLRAGLKKLVATTSAEAGLIFQLDSISQAVSVIAYIGQLDLRQEAVHTLGTSPVRDVIEDGEQFLENRMSGPVRGRFRKLLDLLTFESCIGLPLEANGETHHAVFLLHREPHVFNRYHLRDALAAGILFSAAIERHTMERRYQVLNKLLLSGQLAGGFSHEVYNQMSGLEAQLRNLQIDCHQFQSQPDQASSFSEIRQAADRLLTTFYDLKDTVELFQQLMRVEEEQDVGINEVVQKIVSLLKPTMQEMGIKIEMELNSNLPGTVGSAIQLQQALLNIVLNAVQHLVLKPGEGKMLNVTTSYYDKEPERPIKIRFSDTGPGIHRRLWEKIFDLGFTNRPGGTGQGLYIARSLVETLGGKILVERSYILIGTTFLVELPINTIYGGESDEPTTIARVTGR